MRKIYKMAATATEQIQLAQSGGESAWHHAVKTYGDMGQQTAGANGAIKMTGGKRQRQSRKQRQSKKQSHKGGKRQSRKQSRRQRGGRR